MRTSHKITLVATLIGIISAVWGFGDKFGFRPVLKAEADQMQEQIDANTQARLLARFKYLITKLRDGGGLTFEEQQELCLIAKQLNFKVEICN